MRLEIDQFPAFGRPLADELGHCPWAAQTRSIERPAAAFFVEVPAGGDAENLFVGRARLRPEGERPAVLMGLGGCWWVWTYPSSSMRIESSSSGGHLDGLAEAFVDGAAQPHVGDVRYSLLKRVLVLPALIVEVPEVVVSRSAASGARNSKWVNSAAPLHELGREVAGRHCRRRWRRCAARPARRRGILRRGQHNNRVRHEPLSIASFSPSFATNGFKR
jgi:hypothetical protein